MADLCYICKKPCCNSNILSCVAFEYDGRKIITSLLMTTYYYGDFNVNFIVSEKFEDVYINRTKAVY